MPRIIQLIEKIIQPLIHLNLKRCFGFLFFFPSSTPLAGKFKEQTHNKSDRELQNVNMLFFITGFLVCFAGERLQRSIRDEGMNKKIKDNSAAASWSYTLICFNMNLRITDFKTQLRNWVVHHRKQNIISSNLSQVEILCQEQITWSGKLLERLILALSTGVRESPVKQNIA